MRLALRNFIKSFFKKSRLLRGSHYSFGKIAVYNPGGVTVANDKNIWLQCFVADLDAEYERLLREIPGVEIISPPERRLWGAYSFWFADPDGNRIAVAQNE